MRRSVTVLAFCVLAIMQHSTRFVAADACQCSGGISGFASSIMGCISTSDGPCPPPIDKTKEPLFNATIMWDVKGVKAALAAGANVNGVSSNKWIKGMTPLQAALMTTSDPYWHPYTEGVYAVIKVLLEAGANPNTPFPNENVTPFQWVAYDGRVDLVSMMIKAGADVNAKNPKGSTALHQAAVCDFRLSWDYRAEAVAKVLLAYGAKLNTTNTAGETPFQRTPGYPKCDGKASDMSDCPRVCKVLRDGLSAADKKAILAGELPDDHSREARMCCKDPVINEREYSQCCMGQSSKSSQQTQKNNGKNRRRSF